MKVSARVTVTALSLIATLTMSTLAHADDTTDSKPKKTSVAKKKPAKKKKIVKPVEPETEAAASEPTPAPEPKAEAPKVEPKAEKTDDSKPASATMNLGAPGGDKASEDRSATAAAKDKPISIAPLAGFSTGFLHFGVGARAGYNIPVGSGNNSVYVGGTFMYHFGSSTDGLLGVGGISTSAYYPAAEVGYELRPMDRLAVRPYGGLGVMFVSTSFKSGSGDDSIPGLTPKSGSLTSSGAIFYPGCAVTYDIPSVSMFVGGDARLLIGSLGYGAGLGLSGTAGLRF